MILREFGKTVPAGRLACGRWKMVMSWRVLGFGGRDCRRDVCFTRESQQEEMCDVDECEEWIPDDLFGRKTFAADGLRSPSIHTRIRPGLTCWRMKQGIRPQRKR